MARPPGLAVLGRVQGRFWLAGRFFNPSYERKTSSLIHHFLCCVGYNRAREDPTQYSIRLTSAAAKQFADLPHADRAKVKAAIDRLGNDPRPAGSAKMQGTMSDWRVRVGVYRVVYTVDDAAQTVTVFRIAHRRDVYRP